MIIQAVILITGLLLILCGANFLVDGSSSIARRYGLREFIIGLTIVGIGTSTPEMVVSFISAIEGKADMSIGNIVGSNIFNTMLILGLTAIISPLLITRTNLRKDIPLTIGATVLLILLGMHASLFNIGTDTLSRFDGVLMIVIFILYLWSSLRSGKAETDEEGDTKIYKTGISVLMIVGGLAALVFGGRLFVNSATELARGLGVSNKFIAVTILAAGTSMPELATSVVAALKGKGQLALGNILGSNISNILLILGGSALIHPLPFSGITAVDLSAMLLCVVFVFISAFILRKNVLGRLEGAVLMIMEAGYMWYLIANI